MLKECQQSNGASSPVSAEEARRIPLGLLSSRMYHIRCRYPWPAYAEWTRSASKTSNSDVANLFDNSPQAPVHTDSLTVYTTDLRIIHTEEGEGTEIRRPIVRAVAVVEQRVSHFVMGLAIIGTMTGPLLRVLHVMPAAVFAGVFFVVGVSPL